MSKGPGVAACLACAGKSEGTRVAEADWERAGDKGREGTGNVEGFVGRSLGETRAAGRFRAQRGRELIDVLK